jgi:hypothetical protein
VKADKDVDDLDSRNCQFQAVLSRMDLEDDNEDPFKIRGLWQPSKFTFQPLQSFEPLTWEADLPGIFDLPFWYNVRTDTVQYRHLNRCFRKSFTYIR